MQKTENPHRPLRVFFSLREKIEVRALWHTSFVIVALILCLTVGCETGNYIPAVTPEMARASHRKPATDISTLERGRTLFAHRCIECHTLPPMWKYSRQDWPQIVNDMSHRSNLKPEERDAVTAYILAVRAVER